jgi:hypothetical protein
VGRLRILTVMGMKVIRGIGGLRRRHSEKKERENE